MVLIEFEQGAGSSQHAYAGAVENCTRSLVLSRLEDAPSECACRRPFVSVAIGGHWIEGDFELMDVRACCAERLASAKQALRHARNEKRRLRVGRAA